MFAAVVIAVADGIALRHSTTVGERDGGITGVVGVGADGDSLARGGDVRAEGEAVDAADAVDVARTTAYIGGVRRAVHGAAMIVVGNKGSKTRFNSYDTSISFCRNGRVENDAVLNNGHVSGLNAIDLSCDAANILFAIDAGIADDDILHDARPNTAEETLIFFIGLIDTDSADGVIFSLCTCIGDCIEQCAFSDIRKTNNAEFHSRAALLAYGDNRRISR